MNNIFDYLSNNSYPGRGIIVGKYDDGIVIAYFIMGRSENSRNRVFIKDEDVLYTKAFDESKVEDPSLIIYNAIRQYNDSIIVSNGNQTDTIYEYLSNDKSLKDALDTREYEPDDPNYTPRISALVKNDNYDISILKRKNDTCERKYYNYLSKNNIGHFISTYDYDSNPLISFSSDPIEIEINDDFTSFCNKLWNSLDKENKISLYVRFKDEEIIFNKNNGD